MVKFFKLSLFVLLLGAILIPAGCNVDLIGLFVSNDLDVRLKEQNNLDFVLSMPEPVIGTGEDYSFIVLSDTHFEDGEDWGLKQKLTDLANGNSSLKFAVFLGDITQQGDKKDIETFVDITRSLSIPCYPVIGNHDIYSGNWSVWKEYIGSTRYKIEIENGPVLIMLDSANSFFGKEQLDWLEREINSISNNRNIFVFTHSPLFVEGPADMQQITNTDERARIISILRNRCDIMFMGHLHKQLKNETGNVEFIGVADYVKNKACCTVTVTASGITYEQR